GFVEHAFVAVPAAVNHHGEAFDDLSAAVLEDAVGVDLAVEILRQVECRLFAGVAVDVVAGAAGERHRRSHGGGEEEASLHHGKCLGCVGVGLQPPLWGCRRKRAYSAAAAASLSAQGSTA